MTLNKRIVLWLFGLFLLAACQSSNSKSWNQHSGNIDWTNEAQWEMVSVYHIAPFKDFAYHGEIEGYPIISGPILLGTYEQAELQKLLQGNENFSADQDHKMCLFTPNVLVDIQLKSQQKTQLFLSFDCNVLQVKNLDKPSVIRDFDPGRIAFLDFFSPFFRQEPYFQALK